MAIALAYTIIALVAMTGVVVELVMAALERGDEFAKKFLTNTQEWREQKGMREIAQVWVRSDRVSFLVMLGLTIREWQDAKSTRLRTFAREGVPKKLEVTANSALKILTCVVGRQIALLMDRRELGLLCGTLRNIQESDDYASASGTIDVILHPENTHFEDALFFTKNVEAILVFD